MSVQPLPSATRTAPRAVPPRPPGTQPASVGRRLVGRPAARPSAAHNHPSRLPRGAAAHSSATVLVEVAVVGVEALETATRLAGEIRDLVDSTGAETSGAQVSAAVGLQLGAGGGRATPTPRTPFGQSGGWSGGRGAATPTSIPLPVFVAPSATPPERETAPVGAAPVGPARDKLPSAAPLAVAAPPPSPGGNASDSAALRIYPARRVALLDGEPLSLTRREFDLLLFLSDHAGRVFDRPQLLRLVWGHQVICGERTVDVHIRRLRAKLERTGPTISTVRGVGYRLDAADRVAVLHEG